ncbi:ABC transporter ATP-binding protein [Sporosarcina thermotolerans]|uniref:ABC transporter ATP-binding protein n=1 Tax=Sporosarcina thermotolerans TaxID=633404 RepID=A0AAW9A949_9BACL|nr:ABC transporter ATP-binding protein [Sporosarcina thermotolerans]MDW0118156.1 ABC transporter ATP-binding protein [Sporosarcina thermotolerans]WHT47645.1 ABC transporter ATP-binding protein [Sporosarcina thermotolerans]
MITLKSIRKSYISGGEKVEVLKDVSLSIDKGKYVSITGPSGSGKSTLLHLIGGLEPIDEGEIWVGEQPVHKMKDNDLAKLRLKKIGYVFQQFQLLSTATALENVMMPLLTMFSSAEIKKNAEEALTRVGLAHRLHHLPSRLSGGEQQRVAIARALVTKPEIILADEPTGNLDSETGNKIIELLEEVHATDGVTIVLITQDPALAKRAQETIHVLDGAVNKIESEKVEVVV